MTDSTNPINPVTPIYNGAVLSNSNPLPVSIQGDSASTEATATAAAPSYSEGTANPISQNLTGDLRTIAKQSGTWSVTATQATAANLNVTAAQGGTWTVQLGNTPNTTPVLVQSSFSFNNITTATTTTVKSGAGVIHGVTINTKGTVASTVTIYDNTAGSGSKIAIIDSLNLSGAFFYDAAFATGLTIVTTGTIAPDITVMYR